MKTRGITRSLGRQHITKARGKLGIEMRGMPLRAGQSEWASWKRWDMCKALRKAHTHSLTHVFAGLAA